MGQFSNRGGLARAARPTTCATTAAIYSHAIRGKDRAAAQVWDDVMQQSRAEKPTGVN